MATSVMFQRPITIFTSVLPSNRNKDDLSNSESHSAFKNEYSFVNSQAIRLNTGLTLDVQGKEK